MLHQAVSMLLQSDASQEKLHGILDMGESYNMLFRGLNKKIIRVATVSFILLFLYLFSIFYIAPGFFPLCMGKLSTERP